MWTRPLLNKSERIPPSARGFRTPDIEILFVALGPSEALTPAASTPLDPARFANITVSLRVSIIGDRGGDADYRS